MSLYSLDSFEKKVLLPKKPAFRLLVKLKMGNEYLNKPVNLVSSLWLRRWLLVPKDWNWL